MTKKRLYLEIRKHEKKLTGKGKYTVKVVKQLLNKASLKVKKQKQ